MNKKTTAKSRSEKFVWKGRSAWRLTNGILELVVLIHGGHLASLRRLDADSPNLLWESPWKTIDPTSFNDAKHAPLYSPGAIGQFLSGYTGHALALGYFGMPSDAEARTGLPLHGEPASTQWRRVSSAADRHRTRVVLEVPLRAMGLHFRRELEIRAGESFVRVRETVRNDRKADTFFQWVQHATFGEPLLSHDDGFINISGSRGTTWHLGYEGKGVLADDRAFRWPEAPLLHGGTVDISRAFVREGRGFVAAVQVDNKRDHGFIAVSNPRLRLAAGYVFPRSVFPWVTLWEENQARDYPPWRGITRARGIEFGTTPFPLGLADAVENGPLFDAPTLARIGAQESISVEFRMFAAVLPPSWRTIGNVTSSDDDIVLSDAGSSQRLRLGQAR